MSDLSKHPTPPSRLQADMSIAWEALPSLKYLLGRRSDSGEPAPVWSDTQPSVFDALAEPPQEFREPFPGLTVREVTEPDVFKAFFEPPSPAAEPKAP